jgi:hypothetical protein
LEENKVDNELVEREKWDVPMSPEQALNRRISPGAQVGRNWRGMLRLGKSRTGEWRLKHGTEEEKKRVFSKTAKLFVEE